MIRLAIGLWIMTAMVGAYMLAHTVRHSRADDAATGSRMSSAIFWHPVGAVLGLIFLALHAGGRDPETAWAAAIVLLGTAVVGELFFLRWVRDRRRLADPKQLSEQQIPVVAVATHGILAAGTLIATLTTAIQA